MRVVAIADTHQFHDELVMPEGDLVICAGDVGRGGTVDEIEGFLRWFSALPHRHKLFVPGNHDGCLEGTNGDEQAMRGAFPDVRFLLDEGCVIDDVRIWGSPWTPTFFDWAFMLPRGPALAQQWAKIPESLDILVTHGPPQGILDDVARYRYGGIAGELDDDDRYAGCADLMARVNEVRPRLHLFGHIHSQRGVTHNAHTTFVNCTTNECDLPPAVVDIDVDRTQRPIIRR